MKRMKRWISLVLALSLMLSVCPVSVFAETEETEAAASETVAVTEAVTEPVETTETTEPEQTTVAAESPEATVTTEPAETMAARQSAQITVSQEASLAEAAVASGSCGTNLTWTFEEATGVLRISGTGGMSDYTNSRIPWYDYAYSIKSVVMEAGVTTIVDYAFSNNPNLTDVTIPDSVTSIGIHAFHNCSSLIGVTIPDNVTSIGDYAFSGCSGLTGVTIPDSVISIGDNAFGNCSSLTSVTIRDSVTSIGSSAFFGCSGLTSITIPDSVTSIGSSAFSGCSGLTSVTIPDSVTSIGGYTFSWCSSLTSVTIPDSVTSIGTSAFSNCSSLTSITIPDSVTSMGNDVFSGCSSLTNVNISDNVTSIGGHAFFACSSLTNVTIPDSVTSIGANAFCNCSSLTSVTIPDSVTSIGDYAFCNCGNLSSVTIPDGVASIGNHTFNHCSSLTSVTLPDSVTSIGSSAFYYCISLASVTIQESVISIGSSAFSGCSSLTSVTIPDSVTSIGDSAFSSCSLTSVTIPDSVTSIGASTFSWCRSLISVNIPDSVTSIGSSAFYNCSSLTSITIPAGVSSIGAQTFYGCPKLKEMVFECNAPSIESDAFKNVKATACYPAGNDTWTEDKLQNYGGTITWEPFGVCEDGHTEVIDEAVAATCTESGLTEGSHCSVCGVILAAQEVIKPAGHQYEAVYTDPTFDADGFTTYTCSACGDSYTETDAGTMKSAAASIGSVKYETLAEAFAAATEGDTILMLKTYTIAKGTAETWDLSGKTLEVSGNRGGIRVEGNLTVLGGTFRFLEGAQGLMVWENGQVTIEDGTFHTVDSRGIWAVYGKITCNGGTFYVTGNGYIGTSERRVGSNEFAQFVINDGTFYFRDSGHFSDYGNSTIKGGTFYLESRGGTIRADYSYHRDSLTITGGTFYISGAVGFWVDTAKGHLIIRGGTFLTTADGAQILEYDGGTLGIYGGTFSQDMTPYLSSSYCCRKSGAYYVVGSHLYNLKNTSEAYLKTEAGCTNPAEYYKSCACGKAGADTFTHGEALGHSFTNYVSNDNATCTENGTETASCNRACGTTDEREIPNSAKGHSYQDGRCTVCGDENRCGDNLFWKFDADTGTLTISGTGDMEDYIAASEQPWADYQSSITEVVIEDTVTKIGVYAFADCQQVLTLTIGEEVTEIGNYAFYNCRGLTQVNYNAVNATDSSLNNNIFYKAGKGITVTVGANVMRIPAYLFSPCKGAALAPYIIKLEFAGNSNCTEIGHHAFYDVDRIKTIEIPRSITQIGDYAFYFSATLEQVDFNAVNMHDLNERNYVFYEAGTRGKGLTVNIGKDVQRIPAYLFCPYPSNVTAPAIIDVIFAEESACMEIGDYAFYWVDTLENMEIPVSVAKIGAGAFGYCANLTLLFPEALPKKLGEEWSAGAAVCVNPKIWGMTDAGFEYWITQKAEAIIGKYRGTATSIIVPGVIDGCTVVDVSDGAFYNNQAVTTVTLPEGIRRIGAYTFADCDNLKQLDIPDTVESIEKMAFWDCGKVDTLILPKCLTSVGKQAFSYGPKSYIFIGNPPSIAVDAFYRNTATVSYPAGNTAWTKDKLQNYGGTLTWVPYVENRVTLGAADLAGQSTVWIDGVEYALQVSGDGCYVDLPDGGAKTMTAYTYAAGDASDVHTQYPVSMQVWILSNKSGIYTATRVEDLNDILQYSGMSIRVTGKQGIRMITSVDVTKKNSLISENLAGYTLKEYGTVVAWADRVADQPLVLGKPYTMSAYAYRKGIADPVFAYDGNRMQYTNVLVGFRDEQCKDDLAMRPYMILTDAAGNEITLYGGIVHRSIGYIAYQNRNTFAAGTEAYQYVWDIIHNVYGDLYDEEYAA